MTPLLAAISAASLALDAYCDTRRSLPSSLAIDTNGPPSEATLRSVFADRTDAALALASALRVATESEIDAPPYLARFAIVLPTGAEDVAADEGASEALTREVAG